jgi:16S rRNA (guanine527-N7)-methyltransferase
MTPAAALEKGLRTLGLELGAPAQARLLAYIALLEKWNRTFNLTAIRDAARMVSHHLLDSLAVLPCFPPGSTLRVVDIGSGGGLPGIPLALARPDWSVALVESNQNKAAFLRQAQAELPLPSVEVVGLRVEDYAPEPPFDVAISRAYSDLSAFARDAARMTGPRGRWLAMKGVYPEQEIAELPDDVRVEGVTRLRVPGLDAERHIVIMERAA